MDVRFEHMTNSTFFPSSTDRFSARSTVATIVGQFIVGSPPWNSILGKSVGAERINRLFFRRLNGHVILYGFLIGTGYLAIAASLITPQSDDHHVQACEITQIFLTGAVSGSKFPDSQINISCGKK